MIDQPYWLRVQDACAVTCAMVVLLTIMAAGGAAPQAANAWAGACYLLHFTRVDPGSCAQTLALIWLGCAGLWSASMTRLAAQFDHAAQEREDAARRQAEQNRQDSGKQDPPAAGA